MKKIKITLIVVASLIGCYLIYSVFIIAKYKHRTEMFNYKPYLWIFNDSVKSQVDTNRFVGSVRERDILYQYILENKYYVSIWEFKDLSEVKLNEVSISDKVNLGSVNIIPREVINAKASPEINIELGFSFNHSVSLNIDKHSEIIKTIETTAYKGFYGLVNKLSLSNEKGKHLIVFDYPGGNEPTLFLLYKTSAGFYVVFINSKNVPFDESILKLLNLS